MKRVGGVKSGFTIVELLIVIVVIGILATIAVVMYGGIQQKARAAQALSTVDGYQKILEMYKQVHGYYPEVTVDGFTHTYACLGGEYKETSHMAAGNCFAASDTFVLGKKSPALDAKLTEFSASVPTVDMTEHRTGSIYSRGVMYSSQAKPGDRSDQYVTLTYSIGDDRMCGRGKPGTIAAEDDVVPMCHLIIRQYDPI